MDFVGCMVRANQRNDFVVRPYLRSSGDLVYFQRVCSSIIQSKCDRAQRVGLFPVHMRIYVAIFRHHTGVVTSLVRNFEKD